MDLDWLHDFLALAEHATFSRAADARNVTQPAFSRRIRGLEEWMGAPLFTRGAHGATLTPAGQLFRTHADELLRSLDRARRETRALGEQHGRSLSIAATHALSFTFFPGWIRSKLSLEGLSTVALISDSLEACEAIMLSGEVHFLLCHHHTSAPVRFDADRYPSVLVGNDTLIPLCAPTAQGRPTWPLPGTSKKITRLLGYSRQSGLGRILAAVHAERNAAALETVFTSHLAATLLTMAREGQGVAWLPLTLAREDIESGRLVRAGSDDHDIELEIRLFRSPEVRNETASRLWSTIGGPAD